MDYEQLAVKLEKAYATLKNNEFYGWGWIAALVKEATEMLRSQGDELKSLQRYAPWVCCPRCHQMVTRILESGQCGFCELMSDEPVVSE